MACVCRCSVLLKDVSFPSVNPRLNDNLCIKPQHKSFRDLESFQSFFLPGFSTVTDTNLPWIPRSFITMSYIVNRRLLEIKNFYFGHVCCLGQKNYKLMQFLFENCPIISEISIKLKLCTHVINVKEIQISTRIFLRPFYCCPKR